MNLIIRQYYLEKWNTWMIELIKAWKMICINNKYDKRLYHNIVFTKADKIDELYKVT